MEWLRKEDYLPVKDPDVPYERYGIGLIGCGSIANQAHLPAYQKAGLRVVACCDISEEAARRTAETFGIPFWTTDVRKLLENEDVRIIDLAVHPHVRMDILKEIAKAPRPVLTQKPLAIGLGEARRLGEFAKEHGIRLGVNQQARWAPAHRALRALLDKGAVGEAFSILHVMRAYQDQKGRWWTQMPNFNIVDHGVHYLDLCRYFNRSPAAGHGEWTRLHCTTAMLPGQNAVDPLIYSVNVEFGEAGGRNPFMATLHFNNIVRANPSHSYTWWIDGTEGSVWATHDRVFVSVTKESNTIHEIRLKGAWFPDGFAGSMSAFIESVHKGLEPPVPPDDHYFTVAMAEAMVVSSREGRVVERGEIWGA